MYATISADSIKNKRNADKKSVRLFLSAFLFVPLLHKSYH